MAVVQMQAMNRRRKSAPNASKEGEKPSLMNPASHVRPAPGPSSRFFESTALAEAFHDRKQLASCLLDPESEFMKAWDVVMVVLLLFTATVTPYEVAFLATSLNVLFALNRLVDLMFLADMVFQFLTPVKGEDGAMIQAHRLLAARYVRSWFAIDLVSILPFDLVGLLLQSDVLQSLRVLRVVRLLRLIKLARILRASRIFARWEQMVNMSHSALSIVKFLLTVVFVSHLAACLFRMVPDLEQITDDAGDAVSWIENYKDRMNEADPFELYIAALYWSVMTMTTIGYGDVTPSTNGERLYSIGVMLIGGSVYAYVVGGICALIANMDLASADYFQTLDMATAFSADSGLPDDTAKRVRHFFMQGRAVQKRRFYWRLLNELSPQLREEVAMVIAKPLLADVPFLQSPDEREDRQFLGILGQQLKFRNCMPQEVLFGRGQVVRDLYVIERGSVFLSGPFVLGGKRDNVVVAGDYFGVQMLLREHRVMYSAMALDATELAVVPKSVLLHALDPARFPAICARIRKTAIRLSLHMAVLRKYLEEREDFPKLGNTKDPEQMEMRRLMSYLGTEGDMPGGRAWLTKSRDAHPVKGVRAVKGSHDQSGGALEGASAAAAGVVLDCDDDGGEKAHEEVEARVDESRPREERTRRWRSQSRRSKRVDASPPRRAAVRRALPAEEKEAPDDGTKKALSKKSGSNKKEGTSKGGKGKGGAAKEDKRLKAVEEELKQVSKVLSQLEESYRHVSTASVMLVLIVAGSFVLSLMDLLSEQ